MGAAGKPSRAPQPQLIVAGAGASRGEDEANTGMLSRIPSMSKRHTLGSFRCTALLLILLLPHRPQHACMGQGEVARHSHAPLAPVTEAVPC